jgi:hypothetical protein
MITPGDLLSRPLVEIGHDLRDKRTTLGSTRAVINDALALYFAYVTLASAFVTRWACCLLSRTIAFD